MTIIREIYSVWGGFKPASINVIENTTLSTLAKKHGGKLSEDKKSVTVFISGQRIVYKKK